MVSDLVFHTGVLNLDPTMAAKIRNRERPNNQDQRRWLRDGDSFCKGRGNGEVVEGRWRIRPARLKADIFNLEIRKRVGSR